MTEATSFQYQLPCIGELIASLDNGSIKTGSGYFRPRKWLLFFCACGQRGVAAMAEPEEKTHGEWTGQIEESKRPATWKILISAVGIPAQLMRALYIPHRHCLP